MKNLFIWIFFLGLSISAATLLTGPIGGMTLDNTGSPYIVTADLVVDKGKVLTLKPGCIFLFKQYTGLSIDGSLIAEGTKDNPIIFTSINDGKYNDSTTTPPQPFDWNGVIVSRNAESVKMSNFLLTYSVFGLKCQTENITVTGGVFNSNGQFNMTINDQIQKVVESFPYNYTGKVEKRTKNKTGWKKPVAIVCGLSGIAALGLSGYFLSQKIHYASEYNSATAQPEQDGFVEKQKSALTNSIIFAAAGCVLVPVGIVLYISDSNDQKQRKLSFQPIIGNKTGIIASLSF